jgi:hypothetical protein
MENKRFIEKYTNELVPRIEKTLLEKKPGYEFAIRVESKKTGEIWISSTNNIEQRMATLKSLAKWDHDEWNGVWQEAFYGTEFEDFIFEPVENITTALLTEAVFLNESTGHAKLLRTIARHFINEMEVKPTDSKKSEIAKYIESTEGQMMNINRFLSKLDEVINQ